MKKNNYKLEVKIKLAKVNINHSKQQLLEILLHYNLQTPMKIKF